MIKNNLNLLSNNEFDSRIQKSKDDFFNSLNNNELNINYLINKSISYNNQFNKMNDFQIINFSSDNSYFILEFNADHESLSKIRFNYFNRVSNCAETADKNFNKYKINKFFLLPTQFEIKLRNFDTYKDFILSSLLDIVKSKIIFDLNKDKWNYNGTVFHFYHLYNTYIKQMNEQEKDKIINNFLNSF